jgi:hypothetical protein
MNPPDRRLTRATLERIAREQSGLSLEGQDVDALLTLINAIRDEVVPVLASPRAGVEPALTFELEEWPHD